MDTAGGPLFTIPGATLVSREFEMGHRVTVNLRGGLGNQLFQWSAGFGLSRRLGCRLEVSARGIRSNSELLDPRKFELDYFSIHKKKTVADLVGVSLQRLIPGSVFVERGNGYDQRFQDISSERFLDGYFQSQKYFLPYSEEICAALRANANPTPEYHALAQHLRKTPWIAVHVRRGDYLNHPGTYSLVGETYYASALKLALSWGHHKIVVFSEETSSARELIPSADLFVDSSVISTPGDVVMLMSSANVVIGANSTLSWWGAFLNRENPAKKIFPREWFADSASYLSDIIPENWTVV